MFLMITQAISADAVLVILFCVFNTTTHDPGIKFVLSGFIFQTKHQSHI
jgi:hypothetical protein